MYLKSQSQLNREITNLEDCAPGNYKFGHKCIPCSPGSYSTVPNSLDCTLCEKDFYMPHYGAHVCWPCNNNRKTAKTGSDSENLCIDPRDLPNQLLLVPTNIVIFVLLIFLGIVVFGVLFYYLWFIHNGKGKNRKMKKKEENLYDDTLNAHERRDSSFYDDIYDTYGKPKKSPIYENIDTFRNQGMTSYEKKKANKQKVKKLSSHIYEEIDYYATEGPPIPIKRSVELEHFNIVPETLNKQKVKKTSSDSDAYLAPIKKNAKAAYYVIISPPPPNYVEGVLQRKINFSPIPNKPEFDVSCSGDRNNAIDVLDNKNDIPENWKKHRLSDLSRKKRGKLKEIIYKDKQTSQKQQVNFNNPKEIANIHEREINKSKKVTRNEVSKIPRPRFNISKSKNKGAKVKAGKSNVRKTHSFMKGVPNNVDLNKGKQEYKSSDSTVERRYFENCVPDNKVNPCLNENAYLPYGSGLLIDFNNDNNKSFSPSSSSACTESESSNEYCISNSTKSDIKSSREFNNQEAYTALQQQSTSSRPQLLKPPTIPPPLPPKSTVSSTKKPGEKMRIFH